MTNSSLILKPAIHIDNLTKVYKPKSKTPLTAVNGLNLTVESGQVFGFLGANGAGKTTTIKMICGLVEPTDGHITLNGYSIKDRAHYMRQIGAVLEGTRNVYWRLSALENIMYFGRLKGVPSRQIRGRAETLLKELDLWERRDDKIRAFSRGMQQKVAIACALISDPPIILLDEPTLGLDVKAAHIVKLWIQKLAQERHKTVILTTHQLDMAQEVCNRVAIINKGRLIANQPTNELLNLFRKQFYEIRIRGELNGSRSLLDGRMTIHEENGQTILTGEINGESELYGMIDMLKSHQVALVAVNPVEPNLEDIFMNMIDSQEAEVA
jgi:ABC-2 type transport system ATP-binding protein